MAKKYKRNYLDDVVLRIDFDKIDDIARLKKYLTKLDGLFPYKTESENFEGTYQIDIKKDSIVKDRKSVPTWDYLDAYKNKKITVTAGYFAIEYLNRSYTDSKELINDCKKIVEVFLTDLSITSIRRLGLRYLNRFDLDTEIENSIDWSRFFSKDLTGSMVFAKKLKYPLSRAMSNLQIRTDHRDILIRYGIWNQDFPSENTRKEFILDIDAFSRFSIDDVSDIAALVKEYNQNIEKIFEKSIGAEIKKLLGKKNG